MARSRTAIRDLLAGQLARPVEFVREIERLHEFGVHTFLEVGPGKVLCVLLKQNDPDKKSLNVEDSASLEKTLAELASA